MINTAVITAGGEGKRMKESGINTPKPLVVVNEKPLICYIIDSLIANNIENIIIIEPWNRTLRQKLKLYYPNKNIIFVSALRGKKMFYNLMLVRKYIQNRFILSDADIVITPDTLKKFLDNDKECFGTIATVKNPTIQNNHYLLIKDGKIKEFNKNGSKNGYHGGYLYTFDPEFINFVEEAILNNDLSFSNLITNLSKKYNIVPNFIDNIWDVDCYDDIKLSQK